MGLNPATILFDASGNALATAPASALASTQSALVTVGSDYATTAAARIPKVDALGQQYATLASQSGVQLPVGTNVAGTTTGNFGIISMGYDAANNYWRPHGVNASGSVVVSQQYSATFSAICQNVATGTTATKSLISVWNGSASYLRLAAGYFVCPPQLVVTGALTAVQQTYNAILVGGFRFTNASTGGTAGTIANYDAADTISSSITVAAGATITGEVTTPIFIGDAAYNAAVPLFIRDDQTSKELVIPPSSGFHFRLVAAPANSVVFQIRLVITQSAA